MHFWVPSLRVIALFSLVVVPAVYADGAPDRIDVPLYFDSAGRYTMNVRMSEGAGLQNLSYTFTMGTGNIYIAAGGENIVESKDTPLYNQTKSTTAQAVSDEPAADVLGEATSTTVIKEICTFVGAGGILLPYYNQTFFVLRNISQNKLEQAAHVELGNEVSGIIGFGTNRVPSKAGQFSGSYEDSFIGQFLLQLPQLANYTFGMALGSPATVPQQDGGSYSSTPSVTAGSDAGVLHLITPDHSYYNADQVSWLTANVSAGTSNGILPPSDWTVVLDGWVVSTKSNQLSSKGTVAANLDPLYTDLYIPQDEAAAIHASIPGASLQKNLSSLGNLSTAYTLPCDSQFTFGLVVGSQTFVIDQSNLIIPLSNGQCASSIEAWTDPAQTQYIFGSRLLSTIYLIFTIPRDGSQQIGFSSRATGSTPLDVKSIIGGTVGGITVLVLAILGGLYLRKHCRSMKPCSGVSILPDASEREEPVKPSQAGRRIQPFTMMEPTSLLPLPSHTSPYSGSTASKSYSLSTTSSSQFLSLSPSPVIVIEDDRNVNVAPPAYRGHESYLANLP